MIRHFACPFRRCAVMMMVATLTKEMKNQNEVHDNKDIKIQRSLANRQMK